MEYSALEASYALISVEELRLFKEKQRVVEEYLNPRPEIAGFKLKQIKPMGRNMITKSCEFKIKASDPNRIEVNRSASDAEQIHNER